jgi:hypothetical protein
LKFEVLVLLPTIGILFSIISSNSVYAQLTNTLGLKITSPTTDQQVPIGNSLIVSGISSPNAVSNCQVSVIVNSIKPYQPALASGSGGANDYSRWSFTLSPKYTAIKEGDNKITAKLSCPTNPTNLTKWSSVNFVGVVNNQQHELLSSSSSVASTPTKPTTSTTSTVKPKNVTTPISPNALPSSSSSSVASTPTKPTTSTTSTVKPKNVTTPISPNALPSSSSSSVASTPTKPTTSTSLGTTAPRSTPTNTPDSGKLLYLGVNSKSANKYDNAKSTVSHLSSNDTDNSFATTTKIKTQHTSSDKPSKKTTTITNNIAENNNINLSNSKAKVNPMQNNNNNGLSNNMNNFAQHLVENVKRKIKSDGINVDIPLPIPFG